MFKISIHLVIIVLEVSVKNYFFSMLRASLFRSLVAGGLLFALGVAPVFGRKPVVYRHHSGGDFFVLGMPPI